MLTEDELKEVENFASLWFSPKEIAVILDKEFDEMKADSSFQRYYDSGKLKSHAEMRKAIKKLALHGSSPAQTLAMKMIEHQNIKDLKR